MKQYLISAFILAVFFVNRSSGTPSKVKTSHDSNRGKDVSNQNIGTEQKTVYDNQHHFLESYSNLRHVQPEFDHRTDGAYSSRDTAGQQGSSYSDEAISSDSLSWMEEFLNQQINVHHSPSELLSIIKKSEEEFMKNQQNDINRWKQGDPKGSSNTLTLSPEDLAKLDVIEEIIGVKDSSSIPISEKRASSDPYDNHESQKHLKTIVDIPEPSSRNSDGFLHHDGNKDNPGNIGQVQNLAEKSVKHHETQPSNSKQMAPRSQKMVELRPGSGVWIDQSRLIRIKELSLSKPHAAAREIFAEIIKPSSHISKTFDTAEWRAPDKIIDTVYRYVKEDLYSCDYRRSNCKIALLRLLNSRQSISGVHADSHDHNFQIEELELEALPIRRPGMIELNRRSGVWMEPSHLEKIKKLYSHTPFTVARKIMEELIKPESRLSKSYGTKQWKNPDKIIEAVFGYMNEYVGYNKLRRSDIKAIMRKFLSTRQKKSGKAKSAQHAQTTSTKNHYETPIAGEMIDFGAGSRIEYSRLEKMKETYLNNPHELVQQIFMEIIKSESEISRTFGTQDWKSPKHIVDVVYEYIKREVLDTNFLRQYCERALERVLIKQAKKRKEAQH